jgi:single-strand selective monofunctional uracil DNA glycosylase
VAHATNTLDYAWPLHEAWIRTWGGHGAATLLLGMNPGPWGMAQSGVPFGATGIVRDELEIPDLPMITPSGAHPKRPIVGLSQARQEVSGQRIWSLLFEVYGSPLGAMKEVFLVNHCPLLLLNERGANVTPDKVPASVVGPVFEACDDHLREVVDVLGATRSVGVGAYASNRAQRALGGSKGEGLSPDGRRVRLDKCWHPSPASPLANRNGGADWRAQVRSVLLRDEEMN